MVVCKLKNQFTDQLMERNQQMDGNFHTARFWPRQIQVTCKFNQLPHCVQYFLQQKYNAWICNSYYILQKQHSQYCVLQLNEVVLIFIAISIAQYIVIQFIAFHPCTLVAWHLGALKQPRLVSRWSRINLACRSIIGLTLERHQSSGFPLPPRVVLKCAVSDWKGRLCIFWHCSSFLQ